MDNVLDPQLIARKVWRDSLQDGLYELSIGVGMLITAGVLQTSLAGLVALIAVFAPPVIKRLKARITYPRTGYVNLPDDSRSLGKTMLMLLGFALVLILGLVVFWSKWNPNLVIYRWFPLMPAILFQGGFIPMGIKSGLARYYVYAGVALLLGIICVIPVFPGRFDNLSLYLAGISLFMLPWGIVLLLRFLKEYPVLESVERQDE
jgi:preprotein translocase subunit SecY